MRGSTLRSGIIQSCGCKHGDSNYKGYESLSGCYWNRIRKGAETRNLKFDLSIEDAWYLFEKQDRKCVLTGMPIELVTDYTRNRDQNTASLDRIDNSKGYSIDNVQWVHREVNLMRGNKTIEDFVDLCQKITNHVLYQTSPIQN